MDVVDKKVQHAQPFGLIEDAIFNFLSFIHDEHSVVKHTCSELPFLTHGSFSIILQCITSSQCSFKEIQFSFLFQICWRWKNIVTLL